MDWQFSVDSEYANITPRCRSKRQTRRLAATNDVVVLNLTCPLEALPANQITLYTRKGKDSVSSFTRDALSLFEKSLVLLTGQLQCRQ